MRTAIVTDSNSGITQSQAQELGITVVPMPFLIDGETYYEDVNLTQEQFLALDKEYDILNYVAECPDVFDSMFEDEMVKEIDAYVKGV